MRNYLQSLLVLLLFSCLSFANFIPLYSMNGNQSSDVNEYYDFVMPSGIVYSGGMTYVTDTGKGALYIFNGTERKKVIATTSSSTPLSNPLRMAYDLGKLYIADGSSGKIKTYSGIGDNIDEWNPSTNIERATGIALDALGAYITDLSKKRVYIYSRMTKSYSRVAIEAGGSDGQLSAPADIELYKGNFFVSDMEKGVIYVYDSNFSFLSSIGRGKGGVTLVSPKGISIYNDRIYVADSGGSRIVAFSMDGFPIDALNQSTGGNLSYPEDVYAADGTLYVADSGNKMVRVYQINETTGDNAVLSLMDSAEASIVSLRSLQAAADRLNLTYDKAASLDAEILSAREYYKSFAFSSANSIAQNVRDSANAESASLSQTLDFRIRQRVKEAQDRLLPYRNYKSANITAKFAQFDNKAALAITKVSAKSYSEAAGLALDASALADQISAEITGKQAKDTALAEELLKKETNRRIELLTARVLKIESDAAAYQQSADTQNIRSTLDSAREYAIDGDFSAANHSIELATIEAESFEGSLSRSTSEIRRALDSILVQEMEFNSTGPESFLQPDLRTEKQMMAQAKTTVYTNPTLAAAMAKQAHDSAMAKIRDSKTITLTVFATISIIGVIAAIAAAFFLYVTRMRRKSSL